MNVEILFGRSKLTVSLPKQAEVDLIRKPQMPLVNDLALEVNQSLLHPIGCPSLGELAQSANSACVLLCDVTRPVPNALFVNELARTFVDNGISSDRITFLIATGLHRPNVNAELEEVVGSPTIVNNFNVANHFARNDQDHVELGVTTRNTSVKLDRRFVEADLKIATGLVEPHFMAGYSGGRKVIAPGIAHADTIRRLHCAEILDHPATRSCNLLNNPLHEEQLEILAMLRRYSNSEVYALNTVIDEHRRLGLINFGEVEASHATAVDFAREYLSVKVSSKYQNILTSAGGYPLDQTYYQTVKGMVTPLEIAAADANLLVASECSEGLGSTNYEKSQEQLITEGPSAFLEEIHSKELADIDEWETQMQVRAQKQAHVQLYAPSLSEANQNLTGVTLVDSVKEQLKQNLANSSDRRLAVIPEGPYVIPTYST